MWPRLASNLWHPLVSCMLKWQSCTATHGSILLCSCAYLATSLPQDYNFVFSDRFHVFQAGFRLAIVAGGVALNCQSSCLYLSNTETEVCPTMKVLYNEEAEPRDSCMLGKHFIIQLHPQPPNLRLKTYLRHTVTYECTVVLLFGPRANNLRWRSYY